MIFKKRFSHLKENNILSLNTRKKKKLIHFSIPADKEWNDSLPEK